MLCDILYNMKTVAIIGASKDRKKFGNKAVRAYINAGWRVFPVNLKEKQIEELETYQSIVDIPERLNRVSVYLAPKAGMMVLNDIVRKKPKEVFLSPGSESDELLKKAREKGINPIVVCSIVDIGHSPAEYN